MKHAKLTTLASVNPLTNIRQSMFALSIFGLACAFSANANEPVNISELGDLELEFAQVSNAQHYQGQALSAEVTYSMSQQFLITAPFQPQQIDMLVPHGSEVKQGQVIAAISGSEVHHFQEQLASQEFVYGVAKQRFNEGKNLFKKGAISIHVWSEIADNYHAARIELGHLKHFAELLKFNPQNKDSAQLMAPTNGLLMYPEMLSDKGMDVVLGAIIPNDKVRLSIAAPISMASKINSVVTSAQTPNCSNVIFNISGQEGTADNFHVSLWSEALPSHCQLKPGQVLRVTPLIQQDAQLVPKSSVFNWEQAPHVLVKQGSNLIPQPVEIIASVNNIETNNTETAMYYLAPNSELNNNEVLTRSVSAVQGLMAGMGGE